MSTTREYQVLSKSPGGSKMNHVEHHSRGSSVRNKRIFVVERIVFDIWFSEKWPNKLGHVDPKSSR